MSNMLVQDRISEAIYAVDMAPSIQWGFEVDWESEVGSGRKPMEAEPNSMQLHNGFGTTMGNGPKEKRRWESKDIYAYDGDGKLVGVFSYCTLNPRKEVIGAFKFCVRPDARRQGWGMKLLDEAERIGLDIVGKVRANKFSPDGRATVKRWLEKKLVP